MRLRDKVCIVTGSSRGIGRAIAEGYAKEGALVAITYLEQRKEAENVAAQIGTDMVFELDTRKRAQIQSVFETIHAKHGRIDVLVNNAGVNRTNDFDKLSEEDWDLVLDVDLKGVFLCCQEVLKFMPDGGRIINIGSLSGEYGGPRTPSYAAAKAGVMALTHCLARFVGERKICVNCLSPGVIENEFTAKTMAAKVRQMVDQLILLKRFGSVEDIVGPAVFLASDESSYVTAQTISVNGGAWVH
jgi:3-oxoacyl-[acyl-carrier protein] reductase